MLAQINSGQQNLRLTQIRNRACIASRGERRKSVAFIIERIAIVLRTACIEPPDTAQHTGRVRLIGMIEIGRCNNTQATIVDCGSCDLNGFTCGQTAQAILRLHIDVSRYVFLRRPLVGRRADFGPDLVPVEPGKRRPEGLAFSVLTRQYFGRTPCAQNF